MKKIFQIEDSQANKISFYILCYFLLTLPFDRFYSTLALICFGIHTVIQLRRGSLRQLDIKKLAGTQAVFLLGVLCLIYSAQTEDGISKIGKQAAIFIFPLLLSLSSLDIKKYSLQLLGVFSLGCLGTILYLYYDALHVIIHDHLPLTLIFSTAFVNHNFSEPIDMHATYLSMYACLSLCYFIYQYLQIHDRTTRFLCIVACVVLLAGIIQLGSKTVLTAMLICVNFILPQLISTGKRKALYYAISLSITFILLTAIFSIDIFKTRFVTEFKNDLSAQGLPSIPESRMARWQSACKLINRSPVTGYGTGSESAVLNQQYFKDKLYIAYYYNLNTHNQYLSIALEYGYTGLAIFLFSLVFAYYLARKSRNMLFQCFLIILIVAALSENILDSNKGIFFYAFFLPLFVIPSLAKKKKTTSVKKQMQATLQPA